MGTIYFDCFYVLTAGMGGCSVVVLNLYQLKTTHKADSVFERVLTQMSQERNLNISALEQLRDFVLKSPTTLVMIFDEADGVQEMLPEEQVSLMQGLRDLKQSMDFNGRWDVSRAGGMACISEFTKLHYYV